MKKAFILLPFFLFFAVGCQNKEGQAALDQMEAKAELEQQNQDLVEKYIQAWNNQDFEIMDGCLDPDFKVYIPSSAEEPMSVEQFREWLKVIFTAFPDSHYEVKDIFCERNRICVRWTYSATQQGDYMGLPATGRKVSGSAIEIFRVGNGKILEERSEMDALGLMQQLGLVKVGE